ncbi:MAG: hypothetical protein H5T86_03285 [Armatimonadetes bacterium]|nr:hypothetical protein [Armatimonadota bacterium]
MYAAVLIAAGMVWFNGVVGAWTTQDGPPRLDKKLIEYGWDVPDTTYVRDHIREMEQRPFDGIIFRVRPGLLVLSPKPFDEQALQADLEAAAQIKWEKFTDNFVIMWAASEQDWFNDEHWQAIEHNVRLIARIARLARCVGLCFDPEPYGPNPWVYANAAHHDTKTFAEYEQMARQRGAQFIRAIRAEMPKCILLTFFQLSLFPDLLRPMDPAERAKRLESHHYGLLPAFLNGMLEAAEDAVTIVDGNESAYYYTNAQQYLSVYQLITQRALLLIDPGLWLRYRTQVQVGQALYIDQYFGLRQNVKTYGNYMSPDERARWFEHNIYWALTTTDKYVWCYSERMNWWKNQDVPPGCEEAIRSARRKVENGEPLGFDLEPIIEKARERQRAELQARVKTRSATVSRLPQNTPPPKLDGDLSDAAWSTAAGLEPFLPLASRSEPAVAETRVWVTYDSEKLYVAFRCSEPQPEKIAVAGTARDEDIWLGDCVEVMVCEPGKTLPFYHFIINPNGVFWDAVHVKAQEADTAYNPSWERAVGRGEKDWTVEMAIPWREMKMPAPSEGTTLRVNFCRQRTNGHELTSWSTMVNGFLEPDLFGTLTFK